MVAEEVETVMAAMALVAVEAVAEVMVTLRISLRTRRRSNPLKCRWPSEGLVNPSWMQ